MGQTKRIFPGRLSKPLAKIGRTLILAASFALAVVFTVEETKAQAGLESATGTANQGASRPEYGFGTGSFVVAPIPFSNPVLGSGLVLGGAYLFQADEDSNTSLVGLGGMRSNNGSQAVSGSISVAWDENRWLARLLYGYADLIYDLYILNSPVKIRQDGQIFKLRLMRGINSDLSFGAELRVLNTGIKSVGGVALPPDVAKLAQIKLANLGFLARWDTRQNPLFPKAGHLLDVQAIAGTEVSGPTLTYGKMVARYSLYRSLAENTVIASMATICGSGTQTPFFDQCSIGGSDGFRGFSSTQYYNNRSLSIQGEIRQTLSERFRIVAFVGAAMSGPSFDTLDDGGVHVAGGAGLRFKLSRKFDADFSVDWAHNNENENLFYVYIGQRF